MFLWSGPPPVRLASRCTPGLLRRGVGYLIIKADIPDWTFRDLRRSFQTGFVRIGVPPHSADRCTAHKQQGVSAIYDRYSNAPKWPPRGRNGARIPRNWSAYHSK